MNDCRHFLVKVQNVIQYCKMNLHPGHRLVWEQKLIRTARRKKLPYLHVLPTNRERPGHAKDMQQCPGSITRDERVKAGIDISTLFPFLAKNQIKADVAYEMAASTVII